MSCPPIWPQSSWRKTSIPYTNLIVTSPFSGTPRPNPITQHQALASYLAFRPFRLSTESTSSFLLLNLLWTVPDGKERETAVDIKSPHTQYHHYYHMRLLILSLANTVCTCHCSHLSHGSIQRSLYSYQLLLQF